MMNQNNNLTGRQCPKCGKITSFILDHGCNGLSIAKPPGLVNYENLQGIEIQRLRNELNNIWQLENVIEDISSDILILRAVTMAKTALDAPKEVYAIFE